MEKTSSKNCLELNSLQKSQWAYMSNSPLSEARGLDRFACSKHYNAPKWKNRLSLALSAAENTDYMKNNFKLKLLRFSFPRKTQ